MGTLASRDMCFWAPQVLSVAHTYLLRGNRQYNERERVRGKICFQRWCIRRLAMFYIYPVLFRLLEPIPSSASYVARAKNRGDMGVPGMLLESTTQYQNMYYMYCYYSTSLELFFSFGGRICQALFSEINHL